MIKSIRKQPNAANMTPQQRRDSLTERNSKKGNSYSTQYTFGDTYKYAEGWDRIFNKK